VSGAVDLCKAGLPGPDALTMIVGLSSSLGNMTSKSVSKLAERVYTDGV
jgi:hypothetical protein